MPAPHKKRKIELLAPARDVLIGKEAIKHGADAVYIGPSAFGARAAAGNSIDDIRELCDEAHLFGAHVYVTLNTILYDEELSPAEQMIHELYRAGVDALIVQDFALLNLDLPPIALHASTQVDITTVEKAKFLEAAGFSQIVVARELSLSQINEIRKAIDIPIEAFVHGALCVSYSGRCYASEYCFGRSANRGRCAQFCRLPFDLMDDKGHILQQQKHLLSLKDMCRYDNLEEMMDAGVTSFKIEGRLKDLSYVKNVTAAYRQRLDEIIERRGEDYERTSYGSSSIDFVPNLSATFNRGFTDYFLHSRSDIASIDSPKSRGEYLGKVTECNRRGLCIDTQKQITAGDGICYFTADHKLEGLRINNVLGKYAVPAKYTQIPIGTPIWRNQDFAFEKRLAKPTAERRLALDLLLCNTPHGFALSAKDEMGASVVLHFYEQADCARSPQSDNIKRQLTKLGNTPFYARTINLQLDDNPFIPSSTLANWRRELVEALISAHHINYSTELRRCPSSSLKLWQTNFDYTGNVANSEAEKFYLAHGARHVDPAFEKSQPSQAVLMTCRHCIRYTLGQCKKTSQGDGSKFTQWQLVLSDGRHFPLRFNCAQCEMQVLAPQT